MRNGVWIDRNRDRQYPRIIMGGSGNPDIIVGCITCLKAWPIDLVPGADRDEVVAAAKDADFGDRGQNLVRGVFVPCPLNEYVCARCARIITPAEGPRAVSFDVYGPEKDALGYDNTTLRWLYGADRGMMWGIPSYPSQIWSSLCSEGVPASIYERVKSMMSEWTPGRARAGYSAKQAALYHTDMYTQMTRVRQEPNSHEIFADALLLHGIPNCFLPLTLESLFTSHFVRDQQAMIWKRVQEDPRLSERTAYAAVFFVSPAAGTVSPSGFCFYPPGTIPPVRRLTNAYGLTPIRRRLAAYLVPGRAARAVRSDMPILIPFYNRTLSVLSLREAAKRAKTSE